MSEQVLVGRHIDFKGVAAQQNNILGNPAIAKIMATYDFNELLLDNTNKYTKYIDTTSSVEIGAGGCLLVTAATDTKTASLAPGGIFWYPTKNPVAEFVFKISAITNVAIFAGLTDAASEASGLLPFGIVTATLTDTATDAAGFLFDTRQTLAYFNIVNTKNGTEAFTQLPSTRVPVASVNLTLRVAIDVLGNASYFWNGMLVGYKPLAVTTDVPLVPYFGIRNNNANSHIGYLRRIRVWGDST